LVCDVVYFDTHLPHFRRNCVSVQCPLNPEDASSKFSFTNIGKIQTQNKMSLQKHNFQKYFIQKVFFFFNAGLARTGHCRTGRIIDRHTKRCWPLYGEQSRYKKTPCINEIFIVSIMRGFVDCMSGLRFKPDTFAIDSIGPHSQQTE
jgi:hypothetical protein